jgi:glycosyltransferase involved in cell wall biosynthesis
MTSSPELLAEPVGPLASPAAHCRGSLRGRGLVFWYQATRVARAVGSCRYRIGNLTELLRGATAVIDASPATRVFRDARVVVMLRPYLDTEDVALLQGLRKRRVRLVADFDDLLFDGAPDEWPQVQSKLLDRAECLLRRGRYRSALAQFSAFTVSTPHLAERLRRILPGADLAVIPNGVSPLWLRQGRATCRLWQPGDPRIIRYLVGSPSHDADFAVVAEPLAVFLREHREVGLEIVGPLRLPGGLFPPGQVTRMDPVPYGEFAQILASSWVTLAPLVATEFSRCRSAIKFLESAAFGAPCIASASSDMLRHTSGGVILAETAHDWYAALSRLRDDQRRMQLSARGQAHVDSHGTAERTVFALVDCLARWGAG